MLGPYVTALRTPGAARFSIAGLIGRMPLSMVGLGIVLLVTSRGQNYAVAGTVSATFAIAAAVGGPVVAGFIDRHGQHKVLPWAAGAHLIFLVGLIVALDQGWPLAIALVLAAASGLAVPSMGSLVRARWSYVVADAGELHVGFSWEGILDEVVFIVGPPLATILALQVHPTAGLIAAGSLLAIGTLLMLPLRSTEPPPHGRGSRPEGPVIRQQGMVALVVVFILIGGLFGAFEVVTVAFAEQEGAQSWTGALLACYALGSLSAGLVYGVLPHPPAHSRRLLIALTVMAVVSLGLPLAPNVPSLAVAAFVAGMAVSPVLITSTALVERIVPSAQLTEGITWTGTGLALGVALAAPAAGVVIDTRGAHVAYWICAGCILAAAAVAWASYRTYRAAERTALAEMAAEAV